MASVHRLKGCLITTLSLEVVDTEVYRMLGASAFFDLFPIPERHVHIWHKIQANNNNLIQLLDY